jgi:hypothetical protein
MTDVMRMALDLVKLAIEEEQKGRKLAVVDSDGKLSKELILLR